MQIFIIFKYICAMRNQNESTFDYLTRICEEAGTNLTEACREADIDRSTVERWKEKEPKTVEIISQLEAVIAEKKKANK